MQKVPLIDELLIMCAKRRLPRHETEILARALGTPNSTRVTVVVMNAPMATSTCTSIATAIGHRAQRPGPAAATCGRRRSPAKWSATMSPSISPGSRVPPQRGKRRAVVCLNGLSRRRRRAGRTQGASAASTGTATAFRHSRDRLWIDLDGDGAWDPLPSNFQWPHAQINGQRLAVRSDGSVLG